MQADWTRDLLTKGASSKLAWGDTIRNLIILKEIEEMEPLIVVEAGCGNHHPMGKLIAGASIDSHYVGIDGRWAASQAVLDTHGKRQFAGVWHDLSQGLPLKNNSVDVLLCLEAMEHFVKHETDVMVFFAEVKRTLRKGGTFWLATPNPGHGPLQHPHCHDVEFAYEEIVEMLSRKGMVLSSACNYRARPDNIYNMRELQLMKSRQLPFALEHTLNLVNSHTRENNSVFEGNVLYKVVNY